MLQRYELGLAGRLIDIHKDYVGFEMTHESLEKLLSWKMPFGKHAGTLLADLPGNYLAWFAREGFPEGG